MNDSDHTASDDGTTGAYWDGGTQLFENYASDDFRLATATAAGTEDLDFVVPAGIYGVERGTDGQRDRGAFEYEATESQPESPSGIRIE